MEIIINIKINKDSKKAPTVHVEHIPAKEVLRVVDHFEELEKTKAAMKIAEVKEVKEVKPEEPKKQDFKAIGKQIKADFSNLRDSYDYQTFEAYKTIIPTFHKTMHSTFQIGKVLQFFGHVNSKQDFKDCYNAGWITIGKENIYDSIYDNFQLDIKNGANQIAWKDSQQRHGYLLIQFKEEVMLLKLTRDKYWRY